MFAQQLLSEPPSNVYWSMSPPPVLWQHSINEFSSSLQLPSNILIFCHTWTMFRWRSTVIIASLNGLQWLVSIKIGVMRPDVTKKLNLCKIQPAMCKIQNAKYNLWSGKIQSASNNWSQLRIVWCSRMWPKSSMWRRKQDWVRNKQNAKYNLPSVQNTVCKIGRATRQCPICSVCMETDFIFINSFLLQIL